MNSRTLDQLLRAVRALLGGFADREHRGSLGLVVDRIANALDAYDRTLDEATRSAVAWATMTRKPLAPGERPPSREGSLTYVPTDEQCRRDELLNACFHAGMTESQVIELQRVQRAKLVEQLIRRTLLDLQPPIRIERATEAKTAEEIAELRKQLADARAWVRRLTAAERVLTCVYCGEAYPPGTPDHGADVLTSHVRICVKHPMRAAEAEAERLRRLIEEALGHVRDPDVTAPLRARIGAP